MIRRHLALCPDAARMVCDLLRAYSCWNPAVAAAPPRGPLRLPPASLPPGSGLSEDTQGLLIFHTGHADAQPVA
eukprot:13894472-Alexandrium_andersonii.AAC.1